MYGAIVSSAALAAVSLHTPEAVRVAVATGAVLVIYWISDLYVHAIAVRFDGDTRGMARRLARAAGHKSSVLKGGLPGIAVYAVVYALGATSSTAELLPAATVTPFPVTASTDSSEEVMPTKVLLSAVRPNTTRIGSGTVAPG